MKVNAGGKRIIQVCVIVAICMCAVVMPVLADTGGNGSLMGNVTDDFGNVTVTPVATQSTASINVPDPQPELPVITSVGIPTTSQIPSLPSTPGILPTTPLPVISGTPTPNTGVVTCDSCQGDDEYPLMHLTLAQMREMQAQMDQSPRYSAPIRQGLHGQILATGSKSLLPYINYTPAQRNQGQCGNCWVWAATGALEIDHTMKTGINDRLSIQYFNSKHNAGTGTRWACCGGWLTTFISWYSSDKTLVPWSNTNAQYADGNRRCENYSTSVLIGNISTLNHYHLNSASSYSIETSGTDQTTAINNIKSALDTNHAVVYSYYLGDDGWTDFINFWVNSTESAIFDPTPHAGETTAGGHSVLIVGFDDTDSANPYWVVLNSWGAPTNRSHGLFRLKMNINYSSVVYSDSEPFNQHRFEFLDADFLTANFTANVTSGTAPLTVRFNDTSTGVPTTWNWSFGDGASSTVQHPVHTYTTTGTYNISLNVTNVARSDVVTRVGYVTVSSVVAPVANFTANVTTGNAPLTVAFTDTSIGSPTGWTWFFGDENYRVSWTQQTAHAGWSGRNGHSSVAMPDGSIVLMGGAPSSGVKNDVWRSSDNGATWTQQTASAGWSERFFPTSVAMADGSIVLTGGESSGAMNDVWLSSDNGATWTQVNSSAEWAQRNGHTSVAMPDGSIILMGGSAGGTILKNDVWRFVPIGSSAQNPSHTYTTPGIYPVALQAYNTGGYNNMRKTGYITVTTAPITEPTITGITPSTGINTTSVSITNLSGTNFIADATVMLTPVNVNPLHKGSIVNGTGGASLNYPQGVYVSGNYAYLYITT